MSIAPKRPRRRRDPAGEAAPDSLNLIAYRKLREQIVTLALLPGEALSEATLVRRLQCGRAAIRYAVQQLQAERLIRVAARSGTAVAELNLSELSQAYQVRTALEILAVRLCAQRLTHDDLAGMSSKLEQARKAEKAGRTVGTVELVHAFYRAIRGAAHNEILDSLARIASALTERFEYYCVVELSRPAGELELEEALLKAIDSRDPDAAEAAMQPIGGRRAQTMLGLIGMTLQMRPRNSLRDGRQRR